MDDVRRDLERADVVVAKVDAPRERLFKAINRPVVAPSLAQVLEGIRRCGDLGATVAYVGTDKPFYLSFGFQKLFTSNCWLKDLA